MVSARDVRPAALVLSICQAVRDLVACPPLRPPQARNRLVETQGPEQHAGGPSRLRVQSVSTGCFLHSVGSALLPAHVVAFLPMPMPPQCRSMWLASKSQMPLGYLTVNMVVHITLRGRGYLAKVSCSLILERSSSVLNLCGDVRNSQVLKTSDPYTRSTDVH